MRGSVKELLKLFLIENGSENGKEIESEIERGIEYVSGRGIGSEISV